jgi:hypothetical protein
MAKLRQSAKANVFVIGPPGGRFAFANTAFFAIAGRGSKNKSQPDGIERGLVTSGTQQPATVLSRLPIAHRTIPTHGVSK